MCHACNPASIDDARTAEPSPAREAFTGRMLEVINDGMLGLMLSVGHRTGLLDAMAGLGFVTSKRLAEVAGLQERYVREWLGAMATGGVVEVDGRDDVDRFHEVMAEESGLSVVAGLDEHVLPMVPGLVDRLRAGIEVMDIGCGSGRALIALASRFPESRFTGYDLCPDAIEAARADAGRLGLENLTFEVRDVTDLGRPGDPTRSRFDLVTAVDVIHDQRDPAGVLAAVHRVLVPGGTFLMQDLRCHSRVAENVGHPLCPMLYGISTMHCMTVSLARDGAGLGAAWGEELPVEMTEAAGFEGLVVNTLPHDIQNNWYVSRRPVGESGAAA